MVMFIILYTILLVYQGVEIGITKVTKPWLTRYVDIRTRDKQKIGLQILAIHFKNFLG